jgi:hypothetical protein
LASRSRSAVALLSGATLCFLGPWVLIFTQTRVRIAGNMKEQVRIVTARRRSVELMLALLPANSICSSRVVPTVIMMEQMISIGNHLSKSQETLFSTFPLP